MYDVQERVKGENIFQTPDESQAHTNIMNMISLVEARLTRSYLKDYFCRC